MMSNYEKETIVSVIIPCFNAENNIEALIESIVQQTYKNIEIIIVDDGSTDRSRDIIRKWSEADSRIRYLYQSNSNAGVARNNGLDNCSGDYAIFIDADDAVDTCMIEHLLSIAERKNADIVYYDAVFEDYVTKKRYSKPGFVNREIVEGLDVFSSLDVSESILQVTSPVPWNKFYKVSFLKQINIRFQNLKRSNDEFFSGMTMILANRIAFLDEKLYIYRAGNPNSLQGYGGEQASVDFYYAHLAIKEELERRNIYSIYEKTLIKKVISATLSVLSKQMEFGKYEYILDFTRDNIFESFNILSAMKQYHISNYQFEMIGKTSTCGEYLWKIMIYNQKASDKNAGTKTDFEAIVRECLKADDRLIAIYGAGYYGERIKEVILKHKDKYELVGWFDKRYEELKDKGYEVSSPDDIEGVSFDRIIIAIQNKKVQKEVFKYLQGNNVPLEKIVTV